MFRRRRFGELIDRQLDIFELDNGDRLRRIQELRRAELHADSEEAGAAFGDYRDEVGWAAEELRELRDGFSSTLEEDAEAEYRKAFSKAVRRRYPAITDAFRHDHGLDGDPD